MADNITMIHVFIIVDGQRSVERGSVLEVQGKIYSKKGLMEDSPSIHFQKAMREATR